MMIAAIACHCFTYDSRVLPCDIVLPYAGVVGKDAIGALDHIIGVPTGTLTATQSEQLLLPTKLGGLQIYSLERQCILAHVAALVERGPSLRNALRWKHRTINATAYDGIDRACTANLGQRPA